MTETIGGDSDMNVFLIISEEQDPFQLSFLSVHMRTGACYS